MFTILQKPYKMPRTLECHVATAGELHSPGFRTGGVGGRCGENRVGAEGGASMMPLIFLLLFCVPVYPRRRILHSQMAL